MRIQRMGEVVDIIQGERASRHEPSYKACCSRGREGEGHEDDKDRNVIHIAQ